MSHGAIQKIKVASFFWNTVYTVLHCITSALFGINCTCICVKVKAVTLMFPFYYTLTSENSVSAKTNMSYLSVTLLRSMTLEFTANVTYCVYAVYH